MQKQISEIYANLQEIDSIIMDLFGLDGDAFFGGILHGLA